MTERNEKSKMHITDFLDRVEYTVNGDPCVEEIKQGTAREDNRVTLYLQQEMKYFDRSMLIYGQEIEIKELKVRYHYRVIFEFDSLDAIKNEFSYNYRVEFRHAYVISMSNHESLVNLVNEKIESDFLEGRESIVDQDSFKLILKSFEESPSERLTNIVDRIEYTINSRLMNQSIDDLELFDGRLVMHFGQPYHLTDYLIVEDDREIEIESIDGQIVYRVEFDFDSADVVNGTCQYKTDTDIAFVDISSMPGNEDLSVVVANQIEEELRSGQSDLVREMTFKPILKKLQ